MHCSTDRVRSLRRVLIAGGVQAMYVRDTVNIEWLTGFQGVFDDEQAHAMFVPTLEKWAYLHSDSRYTTALEREAIDTLVCINSESMRFSEWLYSMWSRYLYHFADELPARPLMAIEDSISLSQYRAMEREFAKGYADALQGATLESLEVTLEGAYLPFEETDGLILQLRARKDEAEIERLRAAQAITDKAFDHIIGFIAPGMTEREIQLELDNEMMRLGADSLAFQTIIASGDNGASPHAIVSERKVRRGECIVMDFGARKDGYCSDMTRTVFIGEPDAEMRKAWDALRRANETVEDSLHPGMTGREAHEMAISVLAEGGFADAMGHGLGHGVGMQIHEEPVLSPRNAKPLQSGNVVTVEPGIYIPGRFGMRLEDFGVITEQGFDRFTTSTHEMVII